MNTHKELAREVQNLETTLAASVAGLSEEQAAKRVNENCWNVRELLEHLFLVEKGVVRLLTKPAEQTTAGDQQVFGHERMYKALLNRERKILAPDAFAPKGLFTSLNEAKTTLSELRQKLIDALENEQVVFDGQTFPHPVLGPFTRLDWTHFIISHARRHQQQLEEIKTGIGASAQAAG